MTIHLNTNRPLWILSVDEVASLRHFSYPGVHVILLCFSVVKPQSFRSLRSVWLHELTEACVVLNPMAAKLAAAYRPSGDTDSKADQQLKPHPNGAKSHQSGCRVGRRGSTKGARHADESSTIPGPAFLLVGCACDLRNDIGQLLELSKQGEEPVDKVTAERLAADIGAEAYVECSALTQKNLKTVFDLAIWCGLKVADLGGPACRPKVNDYLTNNHANHSSGPPTDSSKKVASPPKHRAHGTSAERNHQGNNSIIPASPKHDRSIWRKLLCIS
ncbi:unnamed protein product [Calicophoron daubneyi]|uniref:Uncharacterized protein n=1 Tax=Calicophoron daubneyi TaxID=300641 RepID=A0AAV2TD55_CALDB